MQVVTIESETFKELKYLIERNAQLTESLAGKEKDEVFSITQAAEYLGVQRQWIDRRKKAFGYFKEGRIIRIRKSAIDKYLEKHTIKKP